MTRLIISYILLSIIEAIFLKLNFYVLYLPDKEDLELKYFNKVGNYSTERTFEQYENITFDNNRVLSLASGSLLSIIFVTTPICCAVRSGFFGSYNFVSFMCETNHNYIYAEFGQKKKVELEFRPIDLEESKIIGNKILTSKVFLTGIPFVP